MRCFGLGNPSYHDDTPHQNYHRECATRAKHACAANIFPDKSVKLHAHINVSYIKSESKYIHATIVCTNEAILALQAPE